MAVTSAEEVLPPVLDSTSDPPPLFDGTTRLYASYLCPYAQRVWIARNYKGLQDRIKLVPIDLGNRPAWYKERVYPENKVPSLEHDNKVMGESLDLIKYIDSLFKGPALYPDDPNMRQFAEELLSYSDSFNRAVIFSLKGDSENEICAVFDYLETALSKFNDGPFFLGQFSLVDIAYAPFIERFHPLLLDVKNYDVTSGRPKLVSWIEEMNKIEAYRQTKRDPQELVAVLKKHFMYDVYEDLLSLLAAFILSLHLYQPSQMKSPERIESITVLKRKNHAWSLAEVTKERLLSNFSLKEELIYVPMGGQLPRKRKYYRTAIGASSCIIFSTLSSFLNIFLSIYRNKINGDKLESEDF